MSQFEFDAKYNETDVSDRGGRKGMQLTWLTSDHFNPNVTDPKQSDYEEPTEEACKNLKVKCTGPYDKKHEETLMELTKNNDGSKKCNSFSGGCGIKITSAHYFSCKECEAEKEKENGKWVYEVEVKSDGKEYEIELTPQGKVIEIEEDD